MQHLNAILLVVQVILSISLITLVLLQHGKGADAGAAFGSGASATVFGSKGSGNFLTRATAILAVLFFLTCLGLAYLSSHREGPGSIMNSVMDSQTETVQPMESILQPENTDLPPIEMPAETSQQTTDLPPVD